MENIISPATLHDAIVQLEDLRRDQEAALADEFEGFLDKLRPSTIIKETIRDITQSPSVRHDLLNAAMGMASGFVARKIFAGSRSGLLRKTLGAVLQLGISVFVRQRAEAIKAGGREFLSNLLQDRGNNGWS